MQFYITKHKHTAWRMLQGHYVIRFGNRHGTNRWPIHQQARTAGLTRNDVHSITLVALLPCQSWTKNHVLCSCYTVSMSALQSVLPIGVWRVQRCYYVTTTPWCCRHFHSAFLRTARQSCKPGEPRHGKKIPKNAFNRLFHTFYLKYHSVATVSVLLQIGFL